MEVDEVEVADGGQFCGVGIVAVGGGDVEGRGDVDVVVDGVVGVDAFGCETEVFVVAWLGNAPWWLVGLAIGGFCHCE